MRIRLVKKRIWGNYLVIDENGLSLFEIGFPKKFRIDNMAMTIGKDEYSARTDRSIVRKYQIFRNGYIIGKIQLDGGREAFLQLLDEKLIQRYYKLFFPSIWKKEFILNDEKDDVIIEGSAKFNWKSFTYQYQFDIAELDNEVNVNELIFSVFEALVILTLAQG